MINIGLQARDGKIWERGVVTCDCVALHCIANLVRYWIYNKKRRENKLERDTIELLFFNALG